MIKHVHGLNVSDSINVNCMNINPSCPDPKQREKITTKKCENKNLS